MSSYLERIFNNRLVPHFLILYWGLGVTIVKKTEQFAIYFVVRKVRRRDCAYLRGFAAFRTIRLLSEARQVARTVTCQRVTVKVWHGHPDGVTWFTPQWSHRPAKMKLSVRPSWPSSSIMLGMLLASAVHAAQPVSLQPSLSILLSARQTQILPSNRLCVEKIFYLWRRIFYRDSSGVSHWLRIMWTGCPPPHGAY